jgi:NAD(P)-dependent dehydrogenase (short-subunit alcohol dehydrogenase family)
MSEQRTAVVTGASTGFGHLTALAFAADGWRVYGTMRDAASRNADAAGKLRAAGVTVVELDVTDDASVDAAAKAVLAEAGTIDVLVNNAGTGFFGIQEAFTPAAAERQFATNVVGPLRVNRAFLPAMRERRAGLVVYVSSVVGRFIIPFSGIYTASKWALEALAETSSYELAPFGIDVAIVEPGAYPTEIFGKVVGPDDTARVEAYGDVIKYSEAINAGLGAAAQTRNPNDVAVAILGLANAAPGTRPLRTPVPADPASGAINAAVAPIQRQVLEAFGLGDLLPKVAANA